MQPSDSEVIASSLEEPVHFGVIVDAYANQVHRYLAKRVGPGLAQDLTSETFLQAFRGRHTYRSDQRNALPWLYGIATNQLRGHLRSEQRRIEVLAKMAGRSLMAEATEEDSDEALSAAATLQGLAGALAGLAQEARDALALVAVEGLTYEEAALALGVPVGTVRSRLWRARHELRHALDSRPPESVNAPQGACHG